MSGFCGFIFLSDVSSFTHVVFVNASSSANIKTDLQAWAQSSGDGHEQDVWEDGLRILSYGPRNERWAIVFDNADDPMIDLVPFFPKSRDGTIIITSRNRDVGNLANTHHLELGQMTTAEALSTLLRAARRQLPMPSDERGSAKTLMKELGCLAVALVHAGTYCNQLSSVVAGVMQPYTFTTYLSLFYSQRAALMKAGPAATLDGYQRGVYTTLDISYQKIPQPMRNFLHFISHFHHSDIPVVMLASAAERRFQDPETYLPRPDAHKKITTGLCQLLCVDSIWDELQVQDMIRNLRSFSLVSTTTIADSLFLRVHPLVQAYLRDMPLPNAQEYRAMAQQTLTSCCDESYLRIHRYLVPHIREMNQEVRSSSLHVNDRMAVGDILEEHGHYRDAENLLSESLDHFQPMSGEEGKLFFEVAGRLSRTYRRQGKLEESEKLLKEVLEQCETALGTENPQTISIVSSLADTYSLQGRWAMAEKLESEALDRRKRILGAKHPDTIRTAANLACIYGGLGRFSKAEELELEISAQYRRTLGDEHQDTMTMLSNLAVTYSDQKKWEEAERLQLKVLGWGRKTLGVKHPLTIVAASNLAITYTGMRRFKEAEKLEVEVLEQRNMILGAEHRDTIKAKAHLACTYADLGKLKQAEKLEEEVLKQRRRIFGMDNLDTILAASNLAVTYSDQGKWAEAEKLQLQALKSWKKLLGVEHPHTILAATNLFYTYEAQGRWKEALLLLVPVVDISIKVLGPEDLLTQRTIRGLVGVYDQMGMQEEAEKVEKFLLS